MSPLSQSIYDYIKSRKDARLDKFDKEAEKERKALGSDISALAAFDLDVLARRAEESNRYEPKHWLTDASSRAKQISLVTHAAKFTHSDSKSSSTFAKKLTDGKYASYLSTDSLSQLSVDVVGNAAALDVAGLLQLEVGGEKLVDFVARDITLPFDVFASDKAQAEEWLQGFKAALMDKELSSHKLSKQVYFPVSKDTYHIVSPLYSSSLAQAIYDRMMVSRFSDAQKAARKAKREEKYSEGITVDYPNVAVQTFGGTKPQNISLLNSKRGGKTYLLSCQPPVWQTQKTPPVKHKNSFWVEFDRRSWRTVKTLKHYLISVIHKNSTLDIRNTRKFYVDELIGIFLQFAAEVQNMKEHAGWSASSKLPLVEQLWLDPLRFDDEFQQLRQTMPWQHEIAAHFSMWLNNKLQDDMLLMKDVEYREWLGECLKELA